MRPTFLFVGFLGLLIQVVVEGVPLEANSVDWSRSENGYLIHPDFLKERQVPSLNGPIEEDVIFWHYLPGNNNSQQIMPNCNCLSNFAPNASLILAAHGFGSGGHNGGFGKNVRAGFDNSSEPINIIVVDYDKLSQNPDYGTAVKNIEPVGEYIATLINYLVQENVATFDKIFFVGHSLGAHIPNYIAPKLIGGKIKTVFALDPAWPLFERRNDSHRLDPSDAEFVNVMHTSTIYLGYKDPIGHVDFYPNSGKDQPGCEDNLVGHCSHAICHDFFRESAQNPTAFLSCNCSSWEEFDDGRCPCDDKIVMGWSTPTTARGIFYLRTNPEPPYSQQ